MKKIWLAVTLVLLSVYSAKAEPPPASAEDFVKGIYANYIGKDAKGVTLDGRRLKQYFTPSLTKLYKSADNRRDEPPCLDGDPFVQAQEWNVAAFDIKVSNDTADKATAIVKFTNYEAKTVTLKLVKSPDGWRIDDIFDGAGKGQADLRHLLSHRDQC